RYFLAIPSVGVFWWAGGGWGSDSKDALVGGLRADAQVLSYELAIGFVLVTVLLVSGTLNMTGIVMGQTKGMFASQGINILSWNWLPLLPLFVIYVISAVAETSRHPFDEIGRAHV